MSNSNQLIINKGKRSKASFVGNIKVDSEHNTDNIDDFFNIAPLKETKMVTNNIDLNLSEVFTEEDTKDDIRVESLAEHSVQLEINEELNLEEQATETFIQSKENYHSLLENSLNFIEKTDDKEINQQVYTPLISKSTDPFAVSIMKKEEELLMENVSLNKKALFEKVKDCQLKDPNITTNNKSDDNNIEKELKNEEKNQKKIRNPSSKAIQNINLLINDQNNERKSKRNRSKPLQFWKNERIKIQKDSEINNIKKKEINNIKKEEIYNIEKEEIYNTKRKELTNSKDSKVSVMYDQVQEKSITDNISECPVLDHIGKINIKTKQGEEAKEISFPIESIPLYKSSENCEYTITYEENDFSCGIFKLVKKGKKPNRISRATMTFFVIYGTIKVSIHTSSFVVGTGTHFVVPKNNTYKFTNTGADEAKLFFAQVKDADVVDAICKNEEPHMLIDNPQSSQPKQDHNPDNQTKKKKTKRKPRY